MDRHRTAEKRKKAGGYFQRDKKIHMYKHKSSGQVFLFGTVLCILVMGFIPTTVDGEDETEVLKIIVGKPTKLSSDRTSPEVAVSRTGTVAAFFGKSYRISTDEGRSWGPDMDSPCGGPGPMSIGLREGGILFMRGPAAPIDESDPPKLRTERIVYSDDFLKCEITTSAVSIPQAALNVRWAKFWPYFHKGKIVQLPNGDLLATLYGNFKGDAQYRTMIVRSTDSGQTWQFHATAAYDPKDPDPYLVGSYSGYCEPSLALLSNGQLLCIMRTQGAQYAGEYRPLYQCWSNDLGKTWTRPIPSKPYLMDIYPTLAVLDNGVVACQYGRPGFYVAFSLDNGHTWQDRITFSDLPHPASHGMYDMVKVGPNKLVAVGNKGVVGKAWPITVERVKVFPANVALTGRLLDQQGNPITHAIVERSPNRYYLDAWLEQDSLTVGPAVGYRSIQKQHGHPTVQTDAQGRFRFEPVKLGEYILTVEADGYAPQSRNIKVTPQVQPEQFDLKPGRKISNRVLNPAGRPIAGACVVLNHWHVHTDSRGYFHWSLENPLPQQVALKVYKRYSVDINGYLDTTVALSQLESQPITLKNKE